MASLTKNTKFCLVGGVSAGKSTFLNSVFCKKLTQCKIKRTTMVPTRYIENETAKDTETEIYRKVSEKNEEIIKKTECGEKLIASDYKELEFNVGKLDIKIMSNGLVDIYDIPGLNDARTKTEYYKYLEDNFYKFNVVVFFVDIMSGLNTSDEMDILKFIITQTCFHKERGRDIYTLVVVNKSDDMILEEDNSLTLSGELSEMFEQVKKTIKLEFVRNKLDSHIVGITPFCAKDAFLYRMVKKYPEYELSDEERIKIGLNEMGKKFSKMARSIQVEKVKEILQNKEFIDTMINLSGFNQLQDSLRLFLDHKSKGFEVANILYVIHSMRPISDVFDKYNTFVNDEIYSQIDDYVEVYSRLKDIDNEMYEVNMKALLSTILQYVDKNLNKYVSRSYNASKADHTIIRINELLNDNDNFMTNVIYKYFTPFYEKFYDENEYIVICPPIMDFVMTTIYEHVNTEQLTLYNIYKCFDIINRIKLFNKETIEEMLTYLISNNRENKTITDFTHMTEFIEVSREMKQHKVDLDPFFRFVILNQLKYANYNTQSVEHSDELYIRQMLYQTCYEMPISIVIGIIRMKMLEPTFKLVVKGWSDLYLKDERFALDVFYLKEA
jgi:hypothetical protein